WAPFVHPEGQPYFTRVLPEFRVVVDLNVHEPFQEFIDFWVKQMVDLVHMQENHLPAGALELYLEPHEHDPHQSCSYYLVSHSTRKVFWLEEVSSESLGMAPVVSDSHFDIALERLYWVHVEYFPNHITVEVPLHVLDDIILVLSHGQIDRMTSSTSTFPYTADKCEKMLGLLHDNLGQPPSGYLFCVMARVMGAIAHQRFTTFYGEGNAQLDRLQQVLPCDIVEYPRVTAICNLVMWGFPGGYLARLEELFLNNQVFADHWTDFMSSCLQDWSTSLSWVLFPTESNLVCLRSSSLVLSMVGGTSLSCAVPTILSCVASIASGSILHSRHQQLTNVSASAAVQYMGAAKMSSPMGLLPLAVVYSIPRASYFWGLCFIGMHFFVLLYHMVGTIGRLAVATSCALLVTLVCAVLWVSAPEEEQSFFGHILSLRPTLPFCGHGESYLHPPGAELEHMV
ncbi:hypothetical protein SCLCIDRAFT_100795, partial [Scleroderma citrinum Foug A]